MIDTAPAERAQNRLQEHFCIGLYCAAWGSALLYI